MVLATELKLQKLKYLKASSPSYAILKSGEAILQKTNIEYRKDYPWPFSKQAMNIFATKKY